MNLHLTRDEWARIAAEGEGVLFRRGAVRDGFPYENTAPTLVPPAEFVEAAQPCETCHGIGWVAHGHHYRQPCDDCLGGKRRIAVVAPCNEPGCPHVGPCNRGRDGCGYLTVGHVVVEWGPLVVYAEVDGCDWEDVEHVCVARDGRVMRWIDLDTTEQWLYVPPDVDPQSLIGQYALGIKVVEP